MRIETLDRGFANEALSPAALPEPPPPDSAELDELRRELARLRLLCRTRAEAVAEALRGRDAAAFAHHALKTLAREAAPDLDLGPAFAPTNATLDRDAGGLASAIGRYAARLPLPEALHFVTGLYPALLPARDRSARGAYYTPLCLAARLLDLATSEGVEWRTARILDPAAGGGVFLVEAALRMRAALAKREPGFVLAQIASRLSGFELDPHAAGLAQGALEIVLADLSVACHRPIPRMICVRDTLEAPAEEGFDLVVGNPPYGRVTLSPDLRRLYARSLYGHANLYGVFADIALRWAKPDGLIAYLTPTSFLAGQYYTALRELLAREAPPAAMDFVHARRGVFEDVLQETMLAVYKKGGSGRRARVHYLQVSNHREAKLTTNGTIRLPTDPAALWLAPRDPEHGPLIRRLESMPARLADWGYSVSTGPLVWNRFKPQLREQSGRGIHPLIWAESITADGRFIFRAVKRNHAPYFEIEPGDEWLLVREPCVLVQRTTAKEQARRLIAAELPAGFVARHRGVAVENHLNMVRAKGVAANVSPAVVASILNSRIVDEVFRCMNGSVAVSAFELEALPLPEVDALAKLKRLVADGADRTQVEAECERLYGGTPRWRACLHTCRVKS